MPRCSGPVPLATSMPFIGIFSIRHTLRRIEETTMSQASSQYETETRVDVRSLPGYRWDESGQSVLSGALLDLYRRIDNMFLRWAGDCQAPEFFFPTFISAHELGKLDYFRSFPQLVTFPAVLDASETNLKSFAEGETSGFARMCSPHGAGFCSKRSHTGSLLPLLR